jgi:hypothetical protein
MNRRGGGHQRRPAGNVRIPQDRTEQQRLVEEIINYERSFVKKS